MYIYLNAVKEEKPGEKWKGLFEKYWPYYKKWFTAKGLKNRPGFTTSYVKFKKYMPELEVFYQKLLNLTDG
ncbi:MAG: hypothetical protein AAGI07_16265, partial [Bacteroidota bacterium]